MRPDRRRRRGAGWLPCLLLVMACALLAMAATPTGALASSVTVTTTADENGEPGEGCALREAILSVNAGADLGGCTNAGGAYGDGDTVIVPPGTYTLTIGNAGVGDGYPTGVNEDDGLTGDLDVNKSVAINGAGPGTTIIQAGTDPTNGIDKVLALNPTCTSPVTVAISDVTIRFGRNTQPNTGTSRDFSYTGGGIDWCGYGASTLTLTDSDVMDNSNLNAYGAGINIDGDASYTGGVTITLSQIVRNRNLAATDAPSAGAGAGINVFGKGSVTIESSDISYNDSSANGGAGGGIHYRPTTGGGSFLAIHGSTITHNIAGGAGGGLMTVGWDDVYTVTIDRSTVIDSNVSGQGAQTAFGGGVALAATGTVTMTDVQVTNNSVLASPEAGSQTGGGGIGIDNAQTTVEMTDVTIAGNSSVADGGGIFIRDGTANLANVTIVDNRADSDGDNTGTGGGISRVTAAVSTSLTMQRTTVVDNQAGAGISAGVGALASDIVGAVTAGSANQIGSGGSGGLAHDVNDNQVGVVPPIFAPGPNDRGPVVTQARTPGSLFNGAGSAGSATPATILAEGAGSQVASSSRATATQATNPTPSTGSPTTSVARVTGTRAPATATTGGASAPRSTTAVVEGPIRSRSVDPLSSSPDLVVVESNNVGSTTPLGTSWIWTLTVSNVDGGAATFNAGQTILIDNLPNSGITYSAPSPGGFVNVSGAANVSCSIASNDLTCIASGGSVTIGASTGSFTVTMTATPSTSGLFANPRGGGVCAVDPGGVVAESVEGNNTCAENVVVTAPDLQITKTNDVGGSTTVGSPWTWTLTVRNTGDTQAQFIGGQAVLTDELPNSNVTYAAPVVDGFVNMSGTGNLSCNLASSTLTCMASGGFVTLGATTGAFTVSVTATPTAPGAFGNPRPAGSCVVDPGNVIPESAEGNNTCGDTVIVTPAVGGPDLRIKKTNNTSGITTVGNAWTWSSVITNTGDTPATFTVGQMVFADNLPFTGLTYGAPTPGSFVNVTGAANMTCTIASSNLSCTATGGSVTIGATTGSLTVTVLTTPTTTGTFSNPRPGGLCVVDPGGVVAESNEGNNTCADSVTVVPTPGQPDLRVSKTNNVGGVATVGIPWIWTLAVSNSGAAPATFTAGQTILSDSLPTGGVTYLTPTVGSFVNVSGATNMSCAIVSSNLTCTASGGSVTFGATTGAFTVSVTALSTTTGTFANPRAGGVCAVDPATVVAESNEGNNTCADTVAVAAVGSLPDLRVSKTNNVGGATSVGTPWTWTLAISNAGGGPATFGPGQTILSDTLPASGVTYGTPAIGGFANLTGSANVTCAIAGSDLTCRASGGSVTLGATTGAFVVSVIATPTTVGTFANPRAGGVCAVDPNAVILESNDGNNACSDSVAVSSTLPDLRVSKTNSAGGVTAVRAPWTWTWTISNTGGGMATFGAGQAILSDNLPASGVTYSSVSASGQTAVSGSGTIGCAITISSDLVCSATGGPVVLGATTGRVQISVTATPTVEGTFTNPRAGGSCAVDPSNVVAESAEGNNACADSVTVAAQDSGAKPSVDDDDKPRKLTEEQRQQKERTNTGNRDDVRTEGNVIAVTTSVDGRTLLATIGLVRRETLIVEIRCQPLVIGKVLCPDVRVGDYLEADGYQGGKEEQGHFIADDVTIRRNGRKVG